MKKLIAMLLLAALLLALPGAFAEGTTDEEKARLIAMIDEKAKGQYDSFEMGETVYDGEAFAMMLTEMNYIECDTKGMMEVYCFLTLQATTEDVGSSDYDFLLVTQKGASAADGFAYYWPDEVYGIIGSDQRNQPFAWPVMVPTVEPVEIVLIYTLPKDATMIGFLYTNIWEEEEGYSSAGNMQVYTAFRTVMDFRFINSSEKAIAGIYVAPVDSRSWGDNLLAAYDAVMEDGQWLAVEFTGTEWEKSTGKEWEMRIVFEDGQEASFSKIDLDDIMCLQMVPDEEEAGRFSLIVSR